ncbi:hypothetical protein Tco_0045553 [Tanacetum coccineum]
MLAICSAAMLVVFKAPNLSSNAERVSKGTKPGAQPRHKKHLTSLTQPFMYSKEATKGGSSKAPTGSKISLSKKKKESSSTMDSNPSQPLVSRHVDTEMHKEDQQETGGPTSLGVTSKGRSDPQLSSAEANPGLSALNDSIPQQQGRRSLQHNQVIKDLDSPEDDPVIVVDDSDEDEEDEVHTTTNAKTEDTSVSKSSSPRSSQIQELTNQILIL